MTSTLPVKAHASLGASSAHRWMNCPGSVALCATTPEQTSVHAEEGTAAHALGELCLRKKLAPESVIGMDVGGFEVTEEMAEAVAVYVQYCETLRSRLHSCHWIEKRFSLNRLNPPAAMFGTGDFVGYGDATLDVVDYKHGSGVFVDVNDNPQLLYYGLGAVLAIEEELGIGTPFDKIRLTIVQPRIPHPAGIVRTFETTHEDLIAFGIHLLDAARRTLVPGAPLAVGDWCRWCNAAAICPLVAQHSMELAQSVFDVATDITPPEPSTLTTNELSWLLTQMPILEEWVRQVWAYATTSLEQGGTIPGFKLVPKRQLRYWDVNEVALKKWADEIGLAENELYDRKIRSVAQIEKIVGKGKIPEMLIDKRSSGNKIAPESDPRPAIDAGSVFNAIEEKPNV